MDTDEFLTTKAVAERYGIPAATLRWWRHTNTGPASFTRGSRSVVYRRSEVDRWIEQMEKSTTRGGVA